jgi:hypothetical protein
LLAGATALTAATTLSLAPTAAADPDPFIPNGDAGWCPGGNFHEQIGGGSRYCMGEAYPDGSHYGQQWARAQPKNPFSYRWAPSATCYFLNEGLTQARRPFNSDGSGGELPQCGGGPRVIELG